MSQPRSIFPPQTGRVLFAIVAPFQSFFRLEAAGGLVMMACAALALIWANSPFRHSYEAIFHATVQFKVADHGIDWTVHHFTNDALMTLFFVVAGLEIKRELAVGELRTWSRRALPLVAAAGGMLVPAGIYLAFNPTGPGHAGWGIPMATDIAFALGCLTLVKRRVPPSVFVFLTALAIFDDLGAIVVIALFYGGTVVPEMLVIAGLLSVILVLLGRARVETLWPYAVVGLLLWVAVLQSGVHSTVAGVVIGLAFPTVSKQRPRDVLDELDIAIASLRRDCDRLGHAPEGAIAALERHIEAVQPPLDRAVHGLHGVVAFAIVPLFAFANSGVAVSSASVLGSNVTLGAFFGLLLGKPIGVLGATLLATRTGLAPRPTGATISQLFAASLMAGIGFTMSLLVGNLGLGHTRSLEDEAKIGVLAASFASAVLGLLVLVRFSPKREKSEEVVGPVVPHVPRFAHGYGVRPLPVTSPLIGRTLRELDARRVYGVTAIGLWPSSDDPIQARKLEPVDPSRALEVGQVLLIAGATEAIESFSQAMGGGEAAEGDRVSGLLG